MIATPSFLRYVNKAVLRMASRFSAHNTDLLMHLYRPAHQAPDNTDFSLTKQSFTYRRRIFILLPFFLLLLNLRSGAQTSDDNFREPLVDVIHQIENRYKIRIRYAESLVKDKYVDFAGWRFKPELTETLDNIFSTQNITWAPDGPGKYKLDPYKYHLRTETEGAAELNYLSGLYSNKQQWELRRDSLRRCILEKLELDHRPAKAWRLTRITPERKYKYYKVRNIALETIPGVFVSGSLYTPEKLKGKLPVVLNPDGHFSRGRYREDCQYRCAMQAMMGCMSFSYDLFGWDGESQLQVTAADHRRSLVQSIHAYNAMCILDYLLESPNADKDRVAITGASGGGSHTMLMSAIDPRITLSVPVAMMSSFHSGGCPCESGMGVHLCAGGTVNPEIAAIMAPKPMLIISDGKDWTKNTPASEYPFVKRIYGFYDQAGNVANAHMINEGHDYGAGKRQEAYKFMAERFNLKTKGLLTPAGLFDESRISIEKESLLYVFGEKGELLPPNALHGFEPIAEAFEKLMRP